MKGTPMNKNPTETDSMHTATQSAKALKICVFCGSSMGKSPVYADSAARLGQTIAKRGMTLVYGGGNVGLMGIVAESAMKAGGTVIGIIPERLFALVEQQELTELLVVKDMHERKALMQKKADAFISLPGGIGTMEELFEVWSWRYIGYHQKPVALLNIEQYYDQLLSLLRHMVNEGFLHKEIYDDLIVDTDMDRLIESLVARIGKGAAVPFLKKPERRS
jgi:hypothetical protein